MFRLSDGRDRHPARHPGLLFEHCRFRREVHNDGEDRKVDRGAGRLGKIVNPSTGSCDLKGDGVALGTTQEGVGTSRASICRLHPLVPIRFAQ